LYGWLAKLSSLGGSAPTVPWNNLPNIPTEPPTGPVLGGGTGRLTAHGFDRTGLGAPGCDFLKSG